jgi:L-rhamnose mutarotase
MNRNTSGNTGYIPLETENKKNWWKFRQNIIKRNKKNQPKKQKQTRIQSVFAVLFNCKPMKI